MLTIGSLFSGIGGLELGLEWAGRRAFYKLEDEIIQRNALLTDAAIAILGSSTIVLKGTEFGELSAAVWRFAAAFVDASAGHLDRLPDPPWLHVKDPGVGGD